MNRHFGSAGLAPSAPDFQAGQSLAGKKNRRLGTKTKKFATAKMLAANKVATKRHLAARVQKSLSRRDEQLRRSAAALASVLELTEPGFEASPQIARSAQATENRWRAIAEEYGLLDSSSVALLVGSSPSNRNKAHQLAKEGKILGVRRGRGVLYPGFQFDKNLGQVRPIVAQVAALGRDNDWQDEHMLQWFTSSNGYLNGRSPASMMDTPELVLEAARQDLAARW
ncbi:MAG: hypothetical protein JWQ75_2890 [Pseudarthrobacter sp.]|nr:hypothetical protein [Pseudarthrobacter sp.]